MIRWAMLCWLALAQVADAGCRQALALGLDVSGSVDAREYRLQMEGLAWALSRPDVRSALLVLPQFPVEFMVYEWSGTSHQRVLIPWTAIVSEAVLDDVIAQLGQTVRQRANPGTALGTAVSTGVAFLADRSCDKHTLDISGDGKSNLGPKPEDVRRRLEQSAQTINGLVIGANPPEVDLSQNGADALVAYFRANVIMGEDSFVEVAYGYEDFANAMARKLIREIATLTFSEDVEGRKPVYQ